MPGQLDLGTLVVDVVAQTTALERNLNKADKKVLAFTQRVERASKRLKSAGQTMSLAITAPMAIFGGYAVYSLGKFDDAMKESTAIMGDLSNQMRSQMRESARTLGQELAFGAEDAAQSFYYLQSAGLDAEASLEGLGPMMEFARAGGFDLAQATELLTDAQSAMGLKAEDTTKNIENMTAVSDQLIAMTTKANATTEQFSQALSNKAAAVAKTFNMTMGETLAVLGALADQGQKGRRAGSRFNQMLRDLTDSAAKNGKAFEKFGVDVFDETTGALKPMPDVVKDLEQAFSGLSSIQQIAMMNQMGLNKETRIVLKMLLSYSGSIREWKEELKNAGGITKEVADKQMVSLAKQFKQTMVAVENAASSIAEVWEPQIRKAIDDVEEFATKLRKLPEEKKVEFTLKGLGPMALGPAIWGLGVLLNLISWGLRGFTKLTPLISGLAKVFTALAIPVMAIVGAFSSVLFAGRQMAQMFPDMAETVSGTVRSMANTVVDFVKFMGIWLNEAFQFDEWAKGFITLAKYPKISFKIMLAHIDYYTDLMIERASTTFGFIYYQIETGLSRAVITVEAMLKKMFAHIDYYTKLFAQGWDAPLVMIGKNLKSAFNRFKAIAGTGMELISAVVKTYFSALNQVAKDWQSEFTMYLIEAIKHPFRDAEDFVSEPMKVLRDSLGRELEKANEEVTAKTLTLWKELDNTLDKDKYQKLTLEDVLESSGAKEKIKNTREEMSNELDKISNELDKKLSLPENQVMDFREFMDKSGLSEVEEQLAETRRKKLEGLYQKMADLMSDAEKAKDKAKDSGKILAEGGEDAGSAMQRGAQAAKLELMGVGQFWEKMLKSAVGEAETKVTGETGPLGTGQGEKGNKQGDKIAKNTSNMDRKMGSIEKGIRDLNNKEDSVFA